VSAVDARSEVKETKTKGVNMNKFARIFLFCLLTWAVTLVAQAQPNTANEQATATSPKAHELLSIVYLRIAQKSPIN
jgi:hypothetical protein